MKIIIQTIGSSLFLFILITSVALSQTTVNYSGKWIFDKTKSSSDLVESTYDGIVITEITQNSSTISFNDIWIHPDRPDYKTAADVYDLNGKEHIIKRSVGTTKKLAVWSKDKQILVITNLDTQSLKGTPQDFLVVDSLMLSGNKLELTIHRYSKNPVTGEKISKKIYHKK